MKIILTGATGMVGEGVLLECLKDSRITSITLLSRRATGMAHPKIKEAVHSDLFDISSMKQQLSGFDACLFCLGVSSVGMKEEEYRKMTHTLTLNIARSLAAWNPGMIFCYISGAGTDHTLRSKQMWARVKGETENDLGAAGFKAVYNFRPGYLQPTKGMKNTLGFYRYVSWMYPALVRLFPRFMGSLEELGKAMINAAAGKADASRLEVKDIRRLAAK